MALFGKNDKLTVPKEVKSSSSQSTTIITACMVIQGDIKGCGTIHIDGTVHGDLNVEERVIIGKSGTVNGHVYAKNITVSGKINGSLNCDVLEVTQTGQISNKINAQKIVSDGTLNATIVSIESIHITQNGKVNTEKMQSKHILVNGHIEGMLIASELLEINKEGQVKGEMTVKKLKVTEGGLMLGTMLTYEASNSVKSVKKIDKDVTQEDSK